MPDPKNAVATYETTAARGDARAIYSMLSERSKKSLKVGDVERIVTD